MEIPPLLTLIYVGATLPKELGIARLPLMNWVMAAMFVRGPLPFPPLMQDFGPLGFRLLLEQKLMRNTRPCR